MTNSRFFFIALFVFNLSFQICFSQAGTWTWINGDSAISSTGSYGVQGISSPTNTPPSRYAFGYWTDTSGNFWIYGGAFTSDFDQQNYSDLWMFSADSLTWTWMNGSSSLGAPQVVAAAKGVYDNNNSPGDLGYGMFTWLTPDDHLWLFGGVLEDVTALNNVLWQYDPAINEWAWMDSGSVNYGAIGIESSTSHPGPRQEGNCAWTDAAGNLWLFGGEDAEGNSGNDLWKYDHTSGYWAWMSGVDTANGPGSYGPDGSASLSYCPAARCTNLFWEDDSSNFYLAGGYQPRKSLWYQDVWKFDPVTLQWTLLRGNMTPNSSGPVGSLCDSNSTNEPGARYENRGVWKVCDNLVLTYSGYNPEIVVPQNDLWAYVISENNWIKLLNDAGGGASRYGIQRLSNPANFPPARIGHAGFTDKQGNIWMFGGLNAYLGTGSGYYYNDLWEYQLDSTCLGTAYCGSRSCNLAPPLITTTNNKICASDSTSVCAPPGFATYQWNAGGSSMCITVKQAGDYYMTVTDNNGCSAESNHLPVSVYPVPSISIVENGDTLSSFGSVTYQWYYNGYPVNGATTAFYVAKASGSYTLAVTDTNGCIATSNPVIITGINEPEQDKVEVYPNPSAGNWQLTVGEELINSQLEIFDDNGRLVFKAGVRDTKSEISFNAARGVYLLRISSAKVSIMRKLIRL